LRLNGATMGWSDSEVIKIVWEVRGVVMVFESFLTLAWYLSLLPFVYSCWGCVSPRWGGEGCEVE